MNKRRPIKIIFILLTILCGCQVKEDRVSISGLLDEMTDLNRLASLSGQNYRTLQYSSYDRRSKSPADSLWFANEDGFGGEPVPGFEGVLKQPDSTGTGEYLILDVRQPGVIQRLWTASITGKIRLFLDNDKEPVYYGNASDFFWNPLMVLGAIDDSLGEYKFLRQFDATYLPITFSKSCRIEWVGNIAEPHFYHVGLRIYDANTIVEPYSIQAIVDNLPKISAMNRFLNLNPDGENARSESRIMVMPGESKEIFGSDRGEAIVSFKVKVRAEDIENALRQNILNIYFDDAEKPQVHSPLGDFFGAAPGLNPFHSLPFTVSSDTSMTCRFIMPYRKSVRIVVDNRSEEEADIISEITTRPFSWKNGEAMYFNVIWKMRHGLTASNSDSRITDIDYCNIKGRGRLVGAATYLYNPSPVPTSWGNWWGEGDEKIFVDGESFPSFFGTGSEDYYNYSWSSPRIFSFPYCGQPRNDGPGNRGYVANFRWHVADDITFSSGINFKMELRHHGVIPDFSYGSIVYFYSLEASTGESASIEPEEIHDIQYTYWSPQAYLGSAGFDFIQTEKILGENPDTEIQEGDLWAENRILTWKPGETGRELELRILSENPAHESRLGLTTAHSPTGATISFLFNGEKIKFDDKDSLNLYMENRTILDNHFSSKIMMKKGFNTLTIRAEDGRPGSEAAIDFVWLRKPGNN